MHLTKVNRYKHTKTMECNYEDLWRSPILCQATFKRGSVKDSVSQLTLHISNHPDTLARWLDKIYTCTYTLAVYKVT